MRIERERGERREREEREGREERKREEKESKRGESEEVPKALLNKAADRTLLHSTLILISP